MAKKQTKSKSQGFRAAKAAPRFKKRSGFGGVQIVKAGTTTSFLQPPIHPQQQERSRTTTNNTTAARPTSKSDKLCTSSNRRSVSLNASQEQIEFEQEYASTQERCHVKQLKRRTKAVVFQPATFQLEKPPLSTEQLVEATANLVADGLKDLGSQLYTPFNASLHSDKFSIRTQSDMNQMLTWAKSNEMVINNNYFALLQSDDECSDNEMGIKSPRLLNFAPPTFQFQPTHPYITDVDPDL